MVTAVSHSFKWHWTNLDQK